MLDSNRLRVFATVAAKGSFTDAARELGVSQPAVSQSVAELEKQLGCELFERLHGAVRLTAGGEDLLRYAERILHWCEKAERHFTDPEDAGDEGTAVVTLDAGTSAEVSSEDGSIHIRIIKK